MAQALAQEIRPLLHLSQCPSVWLAEGFLTPEDCQTLIQMGQGRLRRSMTYDLESGEDILSEGRTSSLVCLELAQDSFIATLEERLADLADLPVENGEALQILHYLPGQEYRPHYDFFDPSRVGSSRALTMGGQRVMTILMYLNTVESGGETIFPRIGLTVAPQQGDALIFYNTYGDGELDMNSLHGSTPVIQGEKWVATKWIRQGAYRRQPHLR